MRHEAWRRLVGWELRRALRRRPFWLLLAAAAAMPIYSAGEDWDALAGQLAGSQATLLCVLVAAWTVASLKRQFARSVSDDWLLVVPYRAALGANLWVGWLLGSAMALAAVLTGWGYLARAELLNSQALLAGWAVLAAVLQAVALVAVLACASDFLLVPLAVAMSAAMLLAWLASLVPGLGCAALARQLASAPSLAAALAPATCWLALPVSAAALWLGWHFGANVWSRVGARAAARGQDDNSGALRTALADQSAPQRAGGRQAGAAYRAWLRRLGVPAHLACDLARYPALPLRLFDKRTWAGRPSVVLAVALLGWAGLCAYQPRETLQTTRGLATVLGILFVLFRATVSGVEIVRGEREQGTLDSLLLTPRTPGRWLDAKLLVLFAQALPVLGLVFCGLASREMLGPDHWSLAAIVLLALSACALSLGFAGMVASTLTNARVGALVGGWFVGYAAVIACAWAGATVASTLSRHDWSSFAQLVGGHAGAWAAALGLWWLGRTVAAQCLTRADLLGAAT